LALAIKINLWYDDVEVQEEVMYMYTNRRYEDSLDPGSAADPATIGKLIAALADGDWVTRQRARESLVEIGKPAVAPLTEALAESNERVRWEAANALSEISDPTAAPALVKALEDNSFGVRWLAAEGLISLGREGLSPLLEALVEHPESAWLRQGAHHVLRILAEEGLYDHVTSVLQALEDIEPAIEVIQPAKAALDDLKQTRD
jgi:HEAT repeat protein